MTGDETDNVIAFADAMQRYNDYLHNYLSKLAGECAEDLLQETLLRASQSYSDLKDVANAKAWLFRIATNVAMDHFRSRRSEVPCDGDNCMEIPDTIRRDAEESCILEEMNECIGRIVGNLPYLYRVPMLLFHFEGLSINEIASICDISPAAVKVRLHRGKDILRNSLNKACDFYYDSDSHLRCSEK